jgi:hypothetical protein
MDFELSFLNQYNQSIARIDIPSMKLQASGPFACEMHRKFFSREFVSGRTFFASLFSFFDHEASETPSLTLTGDSYWYWILNGNGQMAYVSTVETNSSMNFLTYAPANAVTNASAFVYKCGSPTRLKQPF